MRHGGVRCRPWSCGSVAVGIALAMSAAGVRGAEGEPDLSELLDAGARWALQNVTTGLLENVVLPTAEDWQMLWRRREEVLENGSLEDLAEMLPYVEMAATLLGGGEYESWFRQQLDYFEVAGAVLEAMPETGTPGWSVPRGPITSKGRVMVVPPQRPARPKTSGAVEARRLQVASSARTWKRKIAGRVVTSDGRMLVPRLKTVFSAEGIPGELVWLAEVESSMNPRARNPAGAVGLFQLMPATAQRFGLRLSPVDEREDPEKSARAAARYLAFLYSRFRGWPLTLAAYNAGEGRLRALLAEHKAATFEAVAPHLPLETRLYVPKVDAVISVREGVDDLKLPPPAGARGEVRPAPLGTVSAAGVRRTGSPPLPVRFAGDDFWAR